MTNESIIWLLRNCDTNPGATESEMSVLGNWAQTQLPESYLELLRRTNGFEGFVSEIFYLMIWCTTDVPVFNEGYSVNEFAPGLLLFGTDGNDTGFAFDLRDLPFRVMEVPLVGMSLDEASEVGIDFDDFLQRLI